MSPAESMPLSPAAPAIHCAQLGFGYGNVPVLTAVEFTVQRGEFVGIVGPNGGGKSTLLKLMLGLLAPTSGMLHVLNQSPRTACRRVGYVPQYPAFARDFPITVRDVVLLGQLQWRGALWGRYPAGAHAAAEQALHDVAIPHLAPRHIGTLSGGQMQRVLLARALVTQPEILLLDEPTANVDQRAEGEIFELLAQLNQRLTIVVVSHDIAFISHYVTRVACLNRTLVCHPTAAITAQSIHTLYGGAVHHIAHHSPPVESMG